MTDAPRYGACPNGGAWMGAGFILAAVMTDRSMEMTVDEMSELERFLHRHCITTAFCRWYKDACKADPRGRAWGIASIHVLSLLEIDAHDDLSFVLQMIEEHGSA